MVPEEAMDPAQGLAVAGAVHLPKVVTMAAAITAVAPVPPTPASHAKILVMVPVMAQVTALVMAARHAVSVVRKAHAPRATINRVFRVMKFSAKTHAARVSTWASSATISTNASQPAMCRPASRHLACPHAAAAVAGAVIAEEAAAARARVAAVVGAIRAAGSVVDRLPDK